MFPRRRRKVLRCQLKIESSPTALTRTNCANKDVMLMRGGSKGIIQLGFERSKQAQCNSFERIILDFKCTNCKRAKAAFVVLLEQLFRSLPTRRRWHSRAELFPMHWLSAPIHTHQQVASQSRKKCPFTSSAVNYITRVDIQFVIKGAVYRVMSTCDVVVQEALKNRLVQGWVNLLSAIDNAPGSSSSSTTRKKPALMLTNF